MTDVPQAGLDAAYRAVGEQLAAAAGIRFRDGLILIALEAAAPHIAAAERERILNDVIAYRIGDKNYHPADVTIIRKAATP